MLSFSFDSFDSVKRFVKLTNVDTLKGLFNSNLLCSDDKRMIKDAINYANSNTLEITSFNDGNVSYEVFAKIHDELEKTKIIRVGFGERVSQLNEVADEGVLKAITNKWCDIKNNPLRGFNL